MNDVSQSDPIEAVRAERDEALRRLATTEQAWSATFKTKDALALIASEEDVLKLVRNHLTTLTNTERERFFVAVEEGYCCACGRMLADELVAGCPCCQCALDCPADDDD
jgi:hypothetical protein